MLVACGGGGVGVGGDLWPLHLVTQINLTNWRERSVEGVVTKVDG